LVKGTDTEEKPAKGDKETEENGLAVGHGVYAELETNTSEETSEEETSPAGGIKGL
jgi:hypothetical protein